VFTQLQVTIATNLSIANMLHEHKSCSKSLTSEQSFVSVYRVCYVSTVYDWLFVCVVCRR
jgi:hypothetical protein